MSQMWKTLKARLRIWFARPSEARQQSEVSPPPAEESVEALTPPEGVPIPPPELLPETLPRVTPPVMAPSF